ncbi:hypothetical protein D046_0607B, partial [Vibrio parahaemolyticus V-223/04]
ETESSLH